MNMIQQYCFRILLYLKYPEIGYFKSVQLYGNIIGTKNMFNISVPKLSRKYIKYIPSLNTSQGIFYQGLLLNPADCFSSWHKISVNWRPTIKLPYWPLFETVFGTVSPRYVITKLKHLCITEVLFCQFYCIHISQNHFNLGDYMPVYRSAFWYLLY